MPLVRSESIPYTVAMSSLLLFRGSFLFTTITALSCTVETTGPSPTSGEDTSDESETSAPGENTSDEPEASAPVAVEAGSSVPGDGGASGDQPDADSGETENGAPDGGLDGGLDGALDSALVDGALPGDTSTDVPDGGPLYCSLIEQAFESFVALNRGCNQDEDCTIIGDCGPNVDWRAVNITAEERGYALMEQRCSLVGWDGPIYGAICEQGQCAIGTQHIATCGAPSADGGM